VLGRIDVVSQSVCGAMRDTGQVVATLYDEARKALRATQLTTTQGRLTADLPDSVRELFPGATDAHRAIGFARSLPGVVSVAVGTRQADHLSENLAGFRRG